MAAVTVAPKRDSGRRLEQIDPLLCGREFRKALGDPTPRACATGMHDPSARVASLQCKSEIALSVTIECDPATLELGDGLRSIVCEQFRRRASAGRASGLHRVFDVQGGRVVRADRRRESALCPVTG